MTRLDYAQPWPEDWESNYETASFGMACLTCFACVPMGAMREHSAWHARQDNS